MPTPKLDILINMIILFYSNQDYQDVTDVTLKTKLQKGHLERFRPVWVPVKQTPGAMGWTWDFANLCGGEMGEHIRANYSTANRDEVERQAKQPKLDGSTKHKYNQFTYMLTYILTYIYI